MTSALARGLDSLRPAFLPGALVLLYHRVADLDRDPWGLAVTPKHFAEHLQALRNLAKPARLQEVVGDGHRIPRRSIAITFDDGYSDNFRTALPLLRSHAVPATFFVTAGSVGQRQEFWWDELERLVLGPDTPPDLRAWRAWRAPPTPRAAQYASHWRDLHGLGPAERGAAMKKLRAAARAEGPRASYLPLSEADLRALGEEPLIEVGAHSRTHASLARLTAEQQGEEIATSKALLERATGRPITSFAYPFGQHTDYGVETVAALKSCGFERACTSVSGVVGPGRDPYRVPRIPVHDWDGPQFARKVLKWFYVKVP